MATITDLPIKDFSSLSDEELQSLILQTRSRRRNPDPEVAEKTIKKATAKKAKGKAMALTSVKSLLSNLSPEEAQEILAKLRTKE